MAGAMAKAVSEGQVGRAIYHPSAPRYSPEQYAAAWTAVLGRPIQFQQLPAATVKDVLTNKVGMPTWQADGVLELYEGMNDGAEWTKRDGVADFETLTGRKPRTMEQFVWSMASTGAFGSYTDAFKGTNVVILGGTGNVGAGAALAFAQEGATVYITGRTQEKIDAVRAQWQWPDSVVGIVGDFSTDEQAAATVERVWSAASGSVLH